MMTILSLPGQLISLSLLAELVACFPLAPFAPKIASQRIPSRYLVVRNAKEDGFLSPETYETIQGGRIAVIPNFLSLEFCRALKLDAQNLHSENHFTTDALASYGTNGNFDPTRDRAVLKLQQWKDASIGNPKVRYDFGQVMGKVRSDLSQNLQRPEMVRSTSDSVTRYGVGSTEISYTRFGPGASLARHVDEHHEELKAAAGWSQPTRRSISWLIYLNEGWDHDNDGGQLRCFERKSPLAKGSRVGSSTVANGDLQIGWLRASLDDPVERPVYLDAQRGPTNDGNVALYVNDFSGKRFISKRFHSHPVLYVAGSEALVQKIYVTSPGLASRFHFIEPPKSKLNGMLSSIQSPVNSDETIKDVDPEVGTLVLFDSVALPHEVLATTKRERWATSGWMHEDQQPVLMS